MDRNRFMKKIISLKAIQIRPLSKTAARKEILDYMKKHKEAYASDISEEFGLDLDLVFTVMKELNTEGVVE
jgi:predicted ArsR family transcriptional regulator